MTQEQSSPRAGRPSMTGNMRSRSYLQDHQNYRAPQQDGFQGIDAMLKDATIAEDVTNTTTSPVFRGVPSPDSPPRVVESGIEHTFADAQSKSGVRSDRVIATLFYKSNPQRVVHNATSPVPSVSAPSNPDASTETLPDGLAPTNSIEQFPLEPPSQDPEPLDHLYGHYVSPMCIASFLALMSSLPLPPGTPNITSSHRCLDQPENPQVVELSITPGPDPDYITLSDLRRHELLYRFSLEWNVDVVLQKDTAFRRYPRFVAFDMDSTLIEEEVIDLIAASIQVEDKVSAITARAMNGELDFSASLRERAALLKGVDADIFVKLREIITPTKGARELVKALKKIGVKTAVFSGGFIPTTQWLANELGLDYAFANTLTVDQASQKLTGEVLGTIVDAARKRDLLVEIASKEKIDIRQTVAVGDGANDLLMIGAAGLGVAFRAKPRVQLEAEVKLNGESLLDLLYVFGFTKEEIDELVADA